MLSLLNYYLAAYLMILVWKDAKMGVVCVELRHFEASKGDFWTDFTNEKFFQKNSKKVLTNKNTCAILCHVDADLAHLVERDLAKVEVAGSSPVIRSNKKRYAFAYLFCFIPL